MKTKISIYILLVLCGLFRAQTYTGKVGINTSDPQETLDVNGYVYTDEIYLRNPGEPTMTGGKFMASSEDNSSAATHLEVYPEYDGLFNYIKLTLTNVPNTGVADFNTRIDADKYILVVHNYSFKIDNGGTNVGLQHNDLSTIKGKQGSPEVMAFKGDDNKWHLKARFTDSKLVKINEESIGYHNNYQVEFYMVAYRYLISKQNIPDAGKDLGGTDGSNHSQHSIPVPAGF
ncbi:hypothetical protein AAH994_06620 [Weeksellaceae bacterium A-14]